MWSYLALRIPAVMGRWVASIDGVWIAWGVPAWGVVAV